MGHKPCAKRSIRALALDAEGTSALLCRYVAPTQPPSGFDGSDVAALARLARFVALVPFLDDSYAPETFLWIIATPLSPLWLAPPSKDIARYLTAAE